MKWKHRGETCWSGCVTDHFISRRMAKKLYTKPFSAETRGYWGDPSSGKEVLHDIEDILTAPTARAATRVVRDWGFTEINKLDYVTMVRDIYNIWRDHPEKKIKITRTYVVDSK